MPATQEVRLHSVANTATRIGLSRAATYIEIREGRMRSVKVGRRRLVPDEAIEEWISNLLNA